MLGCYGNQEIRTPNIDLLARTGTRFLNNFVCTPICSASRATLFTGRTAAPARHPRFPDAPTDRESAAGPGRAAAVVRERSHDLRHRWPAPATTAATSANGTWATTPSRGHGYKFTLHHADGSSRTRTRPCTSTAKQVEEKGYLAELITAPGLPSSSTSRRRAQPFFLIASHFNPHVPYDGHPQKYYDMYAKTTLRDLRLGAAAPRTRCAKRRC